ncbi:histidine triad nucleotide-binding protein [Galbitalea sp. SE-J8]|uniref:histidine triad nucleotide-binding protein n=1 Tax=Galbitalea sp. SE-J8 TaxID=3054952 RepID=UPI00259C9C47|nr:histidine triad nucleotide-binding protein [Galbitalea sp. SE-J8]MDM4761823.1 histidine triad nucleotide-binding protein [Galbitalea sp. SE-J8]
MSEDPTIGAPFDTEPSIFTRIIAREIPADIVLETDQVIAIRDIAPKAPVHLLVIPKTQAYRTVAELAEADSALLAHVVEVAQQLADELTDGEFRLIFNSGERAGQSVFHVHAHVLGAPRSADPLTEESLGL